jgi:DNA-binding transcriptional LysR family regulator
MSSHSPLRTKVNSSAPRADPARQQAAHRIERNLEELDAAIASIGSNAKRNYQPISLGTTPLVAANILPPAMREFRKQRPDVRIRLFDADLPTLIGMVESVKLDTSLGIFKAIPGLRREPFFSLLPNGRWGGQGQRPAADDRPVELTRARDVDLSVPGSSTPTTHR